MGATRCIEKFNDEDPFFEGSREAKLVTSIMKTIEDRNVDEFERIIFHYNKVTPFDKLLTKILQKVKEKIPKEGGILNEGLA